MLGAHSNMPTDSQRASLMRLMMRWKAVVHAFARRRVQRLLHALDPSIMRPRLARAKEVLEFAARRARQMRLPQVAASLTFTTVLALVPLLAVILAIFATFPMFSEFREALEKNVLHELLPKQYAGMMMQYLSNFASKAAQLTALGLGFLVATAMLMIATVDRTLNELWHVRDKRPLTQRVLVYWALITLGPLLIGASLAMTSYALTHSAQMLRELPKWLSALLTYTPLVLGAAAYAALYVFVPNRKVEWKDAIIGGVAAALAGELIRKGFGMYIRGGVVTNIYGAFAVVPLFLIWVYLSWLTVLLGGAIASTIPLLRTTRFADTTRPGNDFVTAVALLRVLFAASRKGNGRSQYATKVLSRMTRTPLQDTDRLLRVLASLGYIRPLGGEFVGQWCMTCDPDRTSLRPLYEALALSPTNSLLTHDRLGTHAWLAPLVRSEALDRPLSELELANPG